MVLDIFADDHPKHKFFGPTEEADPIIQAMRYAEGYDAEHYRLNLAGARTPRFRVDSVTSKLSLDSPVISLASARQTDSTLRHGASLTLTLK